MQTMFSLCTRVDNIIIDMDSFDDSYLENQEFSQLIYQLKEKYDLHLFGTQKDRYEDLEIAQSDISEFSVLLSNLKIIPMHSIILTNSMKSIEEAHKLNLSTILIFQTDDISNYNKIDHKHLPDVMLGIKTVRKLFLENVLYGNFNELSVQQTEGTGFVFPLGEINHPLLSDFKANLMYAGRYFVYDDPRSYIHCLSTMILRLKNGKEYAVEALASCLHTDIELTLEHFEDINLITVVPSKPNQENHLDSLLNHKKMEKFKSIIETKLLFSVRTYGKQKQAGSFTERAKNVQDVFDSKKNISGHVLLIDDILTSGSTAMECAKVLYNYGAEKVTILPLAIMQSNSNAPSHGKIKNQSDEYKLNFNKKNGKAFWVASEGDYLEYNKGKERYLEQNSYEDYQFDAIPFLS
ncbi:MULTISPECIES: ComF family protein [Bacillus]|uniref:ComF family protein n=1 Tax=Bacillus TaxID=1386 RepID=UPI000F51030A|nr:ComF family protein [Bacillus altitudinis]MBL7244864.1 ComF family protein [Bacillus altitudinis]